MDRSFHIPPHRSSILDGRFNPEGACKRSLTLIDPTLLKRLIKRLRASEERVAAPCSHPFSGNAAAEFPKDSRCLPYRWHQTQMLK